MKILFRLQCPELKDSELPPSNLPLKLYVTQLRKFYNDKGFNRVFLVIDQINSIASAFREN